MNWNFDLSYSSYSQYKESQLIFYFNKISKSYPDTQTVQGYGNIGNACHTLAELYIQDNNINVEETFGKLWNKYDMDNARGMYNTVFKKPLWLEQCYRIKKYIDYNYHDKNVETEKYLEYIGDEFEGLKIKGYIDIFIKENNTIYLGDWKTNTSYDYETHKLQRLFYSWLCYKVYNIIPSCVWYYTKGEKEFKDMFTVDELNNFEQELLQFKDDIKQKDKNISLYKIGNINSPFNNHLCKCEAEAHKRDNDKTTISYKLRIHNGKVIILNKLSPLLLRGLKKAFSYEVAGAHYIKQRSSWDGIRRMFNEKAQSMDIGFLDRLKKVLNDYAEYNNKLCSIELLDEFKPIELADFKPELIGKVLRPEQDDAVKKFIENKVGIVSACTGVGKTLIAAEVIRRLKVKTLFLCDTLELVAQAKNEFEDVLEQEIGVVGGGEKNINEWITVSTIQSIARSPALFADLLRNVQLVVIDECHTAASKSFVNVLKLCVNARYRLGLSATPYRNDGNDMLMESIIGKTVCEITTADAQDKNYLVKAKIVFHHSPLVDDIKNFREDYELNIVTNEGRNKIIVDEAREMLMRVSKKGVLILTKTIRHGEILKELLPGSIHVHGSINKDLREKTWEKLRSGASLIVIATNKIASKGLNIPPLTKIINAGADGNKSASVQTLGRVLRLFDDKTEGIYIDFLDHGAYSKKWSRVRFEALKEQGHEIETKEVTRLAFDGVHLV